MPNHLFIRVAVLACTAVVLLCATQVPAEYIPPTDLSPGSEYQLIYVTNGTRNALSANIADYNNFVTAEANLHLELPAASWYAVVSTYQGVAARNNAVNYAGVPVYNTRGERVCDGEWGTWGYGERGDLYNAGLDNHYAQIYDPDGNPVYMQYVATGSWFTGSGKYEAGRPPWAEGWPFYDRYITVGLPNEVNNYWIDREMDYGNFSLWNFSFYGLSSVMTVGPESSAVPAPSSLIGLLSMGVMGLVIAWRRRRHRQS